VALVGRDELGEVTLGAVAPCLQREERDLGRTEAEAGQVVEVEVLELVRPYEVLAALARLVSVG
jgi:hypothetical protein